MGEKKLAKMNVVWTKNPFFGRRLVGAWKFLEPDSLISRRKRRFSRSLYIKTASVDFSAEGSRVVDACAESWLVFSAVVRGLKQLPAIL